MKIVVKALVASFIMLPLLAHAAPIKLTNETPWPITATLGDNTTQQIIQPNDILTLSEKRVTADCEYAPRRCNLQITSDGLSHHGTLATVVLDENTGVIDVKNVPGNAPLSIWNDGFNISVKWFGHLSK